MSLPKWYEDDVFVGCLGVVLLVSVVVGYSYGLVRVGRYLERRDLTKAFISQIEAITEDGMKLGYFDGYEKGRAAGLKTCDDVLASLDEGRR